MLPSVAIITDGLGRDGDSRHLFDLLLYLDKAGVRWHVVALETPDADTAIEMQKLGVPVHSLNLPESGGSGTGRWTFLGTLKLMNLFRQLGPRIVHTLGVRSHIVGRTAARLAAVPWVTSTLRRSESLGGLRAGAVRATGHMVDILFAASPSLVVEASERFGVDPRRVRLCWPGVDVGRLAGAEPATLPGRPGCRVLAVAHMRPDKGIDTLVDAAAILHRYHPDLQVHVLGTGVLGVSYVRRAQRLGLSEVVHFPGARDDIPAHLAWADVFIHPARRDGLPLALLEAMAVGKPCVATEIPSVKDVIESEVHGLLCPRDHPALLADRIDRLLTDVVLAERVASAGRDHVRELCRPNVPSAMHGSLWRYMLEDAFSPTQELSV